MGVYSFLDTQATFTGPSGTYAIGSSSGVAEEGITTAFLAEKDTLTPGADGEIMHSLHGSNAGKWTIRFLKTSATNALLSSSYNTDRASGGSSWGQNTLRLTNTTSGDVVTLTQAAFVKHADLTYATEGGMQEWEFQGKLHVSLGA